MNELMDFTRNVLERKGALIDREPGRIKAVIPGDIASDLGIPEYTIFSGEEELGKNEILLAYGSDIVEKLAGLMKDEGKASRIFLSDIRSGKQIDEDDIRKNFQFINTKLGKVESVRTNILYYVFNFRYSLISDERKDGILTDVVNSLTLAEVPGMEESSMVCYPENFRVEIEEADVPLFSFEPVSKAYKKATIDAWRKIEKEVEHFRTILSRRLERDSARVKEYYDNLLKELKKRRGRKHTPLNSTELEGKAEALKLEFESRRADIKKKYDTSITVSLFSGALMVVPSTVARTEVHFKKESRILTIPWNPVTKTLEELVCEGCMENTNRIFFCSNMHLVCDLCVGTCSQCGRKYCRACQENRVPCEHVVWT